MSDTTARHRLTDSKRWDMTSIVDLAKQLGVNMDRLKAMQWIVAVSKAERESFALDLPTGVFGAPGCRWSISIRTISTTSGAWRSGCAPRAGPTSNRRLQ